MPPILNGKKTDFNDLATAKGIKAVSETIDVALAAHRTGSIPSGDDAHLHTHPALASDSNILARFEDDVQQCGVVGEVRGAKLLFLILVSRVLAEPVSVVVKGLSSSGKSYMTEKTLKFFPPSAYIAMTAMSERALVYMNEEFKHRTLVIYEATALSEERERTEGNLTAYFVRSLLSEGRLSYKVTVRAPGGFATKSIDKEGPTNLILTTTFTELHGENETRLLSIPTNDSQEQTKAIMKRLAQGHHADMDFRRWHALQEWLLRAEHRVVIPYAGYLAEQIPPVAVRLRRDFKSLLRLIEAHAILHQCTRARDESGRILADKDDYLAVRALIADLVASGVGATVPETMRTTVEAVRNADLGEGASVRRIAEMLKLDRSAAQRRLTSARERGYLLNLEEKRGRPARWTLGDPLPDELELLPLDLPSQGCAQSPPKTYTPPNSVSAADPKGSGEGVQ
jgi:hypothetical protein